MKKIYVTIKDVVIKKNRNILKYCKNESYVIYEINLDLKTRRDNIYFLYRYFFKIILRFNNVICSY